MVLIVGLMSAACAGPQGSPEVATTVTVTVAQTAATSGSTMPTRDPVTTSTSTTTEPPAATVGSTGPVTAVEVLPIDDETAARMQFSWHAGCPVGLESLRLLRLPYHDMQGAARVGELVVNVDVADDVVAVFETLFEAGFPIERMELVDVYVGDDLASMRANNTSAFNCRYVDGTTRWSEHAYGRAIDINPLLKPWVRGSQVSPPEGAVYVDRSLEMPGMIHDGDVVVDAFVAIGWGWGGIWRTSKDYQHFSANGR